MSRPPSHGRILPPGGLWLALAAVLGALHLPAQVRGQDRSVRQAAIADARAAWAILRDPARPIGDRDAAAGTLIVQSINLDVARDVGEFLVNQNEPRETRLRVLAAIARCWDVPSRLFRPVLEVVTGPDVVASAAALPALGAVRTKQAIEILVRHLDSDMPPETRQSAREALVQCTGRDDLGADPRAWTQWLDEHRDTNGPGWQALLAQGVWERMQRVSADRESLRERLAEGYRRLYLALPTDDRPRLITQLLDGSRPELRDLAFELIDREIAAGNPIDGSIADAASRLLRSPRAAVRGRAAALLTQLPASGLPAGLLSALREETDPEAAEHMLQAIARWPHASSIPDVLRWLEAAPSRGAVEAASAALGAGLLMGSGERRRVLDVIRRLPPERMPPAACRLLVTLGSDADRAAVGSMLAAGDPALRSAAAEALASLPEAVDAILEAARSDPGLYSAAAQCVAAAAPTAAGYAALAAIAAPTPESRDAGLLRVASMLSAADLVRVALGPDVPLAWRDAILSRLIAHGAGLRSEPEDPAAIAAGILLLVETRLGLRQPGRAITALDALPPNPPGVDAAALLRLRVVTLIWTNRIADAKALEAPASFWLDGLDLAVDEPHARAVISEIRGHFGTELSPALAVRLEAMSARLEAAAPERNQTQGAESPKDPGR